MSSRASIIFCVVFAAVGGVVSYRAVLTKFPTYDEPQHFASAYAHVFAQDDRIDSENPVLWKSWIMLPISRGAITIDPANPEWRRAGRWSELALFEHHPEAGVALINRARFVMLLLGVILVLASAWWAYQIAGPAAAIAAAALLAFDPNLLANAPLIKNDVPMAIATLVAIISMWRVGRRATSLNLLSLAVACAVAINVKFSAALVPAIVLLCLIARAGMKTPWRCFGRELNSKGARLIVPVVAFAIIAVLTFVITWASYGFRYASSNDPSLTWQVDQPMGGAVDHLLTFVSAHHLLPEAFCVGFIRQHAAIHATQNYLLGQISVKGWWYYFPFAFVVKSPLSTLAALLLAVIIWLKLRKSSVVATNRWACICLGLPTLFYLLSAMSSDYNHGVRSLLPIYPLIFISASISFSRALKVWPAKARAIGAILLVGLATESLVVYPNFLSFFNVAAGGSQGGFNLLGDSNLDWGQDLFLLLDWQNKHRDTRMYAAYYGGVDPLRVNLRYLRLPGYWVAVPDVPPDPKEPGVLAISATLLQGNYIRPPWDALYAEIRTWKPREILGGSIYLYDFPSKEMQQYSQESPAQ